jgi:hypothetical protein
VLLRSDVLAASQVNLIIFFPYTLLEHLSSAGKVHKDGKYFPDAAWDSADNSLTARTSKERPLAAVN